ncbi:benzoylformate decarboxylase [Micromonospora sp. HM5-17]|jgi:benzoylformate decarboxylase|uniref:benzoylformate decarboxylase n=1 Tax=Micromonospora sp. HM5-17 TaxID=2487710 RepID=UPI000F47F070|nr:benzoylformate decarboxylase [Micromonospora sp. HM5-17]ROT33141.1 benzoylformate decarboxylase [Micromonospora sp. HM5-17]
MTTVHEATYELLRSLGMTTVFGNPGSTEEPFLKDFPTDFTYVLALQEASAVAMADGYAQASGRPVHVNLHTAPGTGNGMGSLVTAWHNKTPMIVTAGQQTRTMSLFEPMLTNLRPTLLPEPYVKWSHEPLRAQDIPDAFLRAHATAVQPPAGPVYLSLPLDDWDEPALYTPAPRRVSTRVAPDPDALARFAGLIAASRNPMLVCGAGIDRSGSWAEAVALAERLCAPVWQPPFADRVGFPQDHPQFQGLLPPAIGPLAEKLVGHDLVLVVGAPVFRYYPYVPGEHGYLPPGTRLLHLTDDPDEAARAPVGDCVVGDVGLACAALTAQLPATDRQPPAPRPAPPTPGPAAALSPEALFAALAAEWPADGVLVPETPSNLSALHRQLTITRPASYFKMASGGLGFALPAAVGIALAQRDTGQHRPVIAVIGDGSFQYSPQALWTAAQHRLPVVIVVPVNEQYGVLKAFAALEDTPGVPGLELPGLDVATIARGYGCTAHQLDSLDDFREAFRVALHGDGPTVLAVPITRDVAPLL